LICLPIKNLGGLRLGVICPANTKTSNGDAAYYSDSSRFGLLESSLEVSRQCTCFARARWTGPPDQPCPERTSSTALQLENATNETAFLGHASLTRQNRKSSLQNSRHRLLSQGSAASPSVRWFNRPEASRSRQGLCRGSPVATPACRRECACVHARAARPSAQVA